MGLVSENVQQFKRGQKPAKALSIGNVHRYKDADVLLNDVVSKFGLYDFEFQNKNAKPGAIYDDVPRFRFWSKAPNEISAKTLKSIENFINENSPYKVRMDGSGRWQAENAGNGMYFDFRLLNRVQENVQNFQRGSDPKDGLDIGMNSSQFWPKKYEELTPEEKKIAAKRFKDSGKYQSWLYNNYHEIHDDFVSQDYMIEPSHAFLEDRLGKDPYQGAEGPIFDMEDNKKFGYDVDRNPPTIDFNGNFKVNDLDLFADFLGIPIEMLHENDWEVVGSELEFTPWEDEFTEKEMKHIRNAEIIWDKYINDLGQRIKDHYNWYEESDEAVEQALEFSHAQEDFGPDLHMIKEDMGMSGTNVGTMQTPISKRKIAKRKGKIEMDELEEEQVHPDDKIGQSMLKKTGTPNYFKSDKKKQTVSQKKVNEMNTHPDDKIAQMMLDRLGISQQYFKSGPDQTTNQLDVEKVKKTYVNDDYAETDTDKEGDTKGNLKGTRAIKVAK